MNMDFFIKLLIALVFGAILGLERSLRRKNASLKTGIVLTIASCMVTIVSIECSKIYAQAYVTPMDPLRLAAQLISGISFIGAGIILTKNSDAVSGLTTAALMWASVGFGIAIGAGFYKEAASALGLIMFGVEVLPILVKSIGPKRLKEKPLKLKFSIEESKDLTLLMKELKSKDIRILKVKVRDTETSPKMECSVTVDEKRYTTEVYEAIKSIDGIVSAEVESL
jgi:putative Mg2+ transporter-C (MgtC) family protein